MLITAIGNGNVAMAMSANEAMTLMNYLALGYSKEDITTVSDTLAAVKNVDIPEQNVYAHLEAIRVQLDDQEASIYPHLAI